MLMYLRDVALKKDTSFSILQLFQKYPKVEGKNLRKLVELAWSVKESLDQDNHKESEKKKEHQLTKNTYQTSANHNHSEPQNIYPSLD